jgi:hypothetical protein
MEEIQNDGNREMMQEETMAEETIQLEAIQESNMPEEMRADIKQEETAAEEAIPVEELLEGTTAEETMQAEANQEETLQAEATQEEALQEEAIQEEAMQAETMAEETVAEEVPAEFVPELTIPEKYPSFKLEDWVRVFGDINVHADRERPASTLWLDVLEECSGVAEHVRQEEYYKALDSIRDATARVFSFIAKYSVNVTDEIIWNEGINLRPWEGHDSSVTEWVLRRYPNLCSACAHSPCTCPSLRASREAREDTFDMGKSLNALWRKDKTWKKDISHNAGLYNTEKLVSMFREIYGGAHYDLPISSICCHLLEEAGEVATTLTLMDNIQTLKKENNPPGGYWENEAYLNQRLKDEISDVISWLMASINKINLMFRAAYLHRSYPLEATNGEYKHITLSDLLFSRYYSQELASFYCPSCKSVMCWPACRKEGLLAATESSRRRNDDLNWRFERMLEAEKRRLLRERVNIRGKLLKGMEEADVEDGVLITDMARNDVGLLVNLGFLSNHALSLNESGSVKMQSIDPEKDVTLTVRRIAQADPSIGFRYFYGAET